MPVRLAVVGSTALGGPRSRQIIMAAIERHGATKIVSGGAKGIDSLAAAIGRELGLEVDERKPDIEQWASKCRIEEHGGLKLPVVIKGYQARNQEIAENCDVLLRIAWDPAEQLRVTRRKPTYGSGWTRDQALKCNVLCEEFILTLEQDKVTA